MSGRLILDKPVPNTMVGGVKQTRVKPGLVLPEWKTGRGYVLVYEPSGMAPSAALIFVHGGSFTGLSPEEGAYVYMAQKLCKSTGMAIIVPDYPLSPEYTYPAQPNAITQTRRYYDKRYESFLLGSDSAGGAIAWSAMLVNPSAFAKAWFLSPWFNLECDSDSYKSRQYCKSTGEGDRLYKATAREKIEMYSKVAEEYLGDKCRFQDPVANPSLVETRRLAKLPPILILVGDQDSIRDDGLLMIAKMQGAGNECFGTLYDDMWHDWMLYSQRSCPRQGQAAYAQILAFMTKRTVGCTIEQDKLPTANVSVVLSAKEADRDS